MVANPSGKPVLEELDNWNLVFCDDFNARVIDPDAWTIYDSHGHDSERGPKSASLAIVDESVLTLRVAEIGGVFTGSGGRCKESELTYGRYLVRARYNHGDNTKAVGLLWPSEGWPPEIDFIEYSADDPMHEHVFFTNHYAIDNQMQHASLKLDSSKWHTFDVTWLPDGIRYRVDGALIATHTGHVPDVPMWLGLSNNLNRNGNRPDPGVVVDWDIDWVSVFSPTAARLRKAYAVAREH